MQITRTKAFLSLLFILVVSFANAQVHPKEALGRKIFDSFRTQNFKALYGSSIFSLTEENFKFLLWNLRNQAIRDDLISLHQLPSLPRLRPLKPDGISLLSTIGEMNGGIFLLLLLT